LSRRNESKIKIKIKIGKRIKMQSKSRIRRPMAGVVDGQLFSN